MKCAVEKKLIWSLFFQFDDVGTDDWIFVLRSNELYAMSNASSSPDGKGSAWA